jgi:outer membrane protein OmpA-like peptidoglycan-associated protein
MRFNRTTFGFVGLTLVAAVSFSTSIAQKNKKPNEKLILNMNFDHVKGEDVTELNNIDVVGKGVSSPTELKADVFHKEGSGDVKIPTNIYGMEDPTSENGGDVYVGIVAYKPGKAAGERSYVTIQLNNNGSQVTLKKGLTYCVEYSLSLSESSKFACNNLAMYFSKDQLGDGAAGAVYLANDPNKKAAEYVVKGQMNKIYNGFFGWEKVCNTYIAKGDEKYITIGNFDKNETTKFQTVKKPKDSEADPLAHAYYYIDNVIIRLVDNVSECACYNARPPKIEDNFSTLIYDKEPEITDKMPIDKKIALQTIYFRQGKASLTQNAKKHMDFVIQEMNANPALKIEVSGNNDSLEVKAGLESEEYLDLDRERVKVVIKYFTSQGISEDRLKPIYNATAVPSSEIVEDDEMDLMQAKNRRVEFKVVK